MTPPSQDGSASTHDRANQPSQSEMKSDCPSRKSDGTDGKLLWEHFPPFRALLAAVDVARLVLAPELCVISSCGAVRFLAGIKVVLQGSIKEVPTVTVLYLSVDVKYLIILLKLVHQGRHRLEGEERGFSSFHSHEHCHCWRSSCRGVPSPP